MAKVFIINHNFRKDYSSIPDSLGKKIFITEGISRDTADELYNIFNSAFENSTTDDYLVLCGPPLAIAIAYHAWREVHNSCQLFSWDNGKRGYTLIQV